MDTALVQAILTIPSTYNGKKAKRGQGRQEAT